MDPMCRIILEKSYEAIVDSGNKLQVQYNYCIRSNLNIENQPKFETQLFKINTWSLEYLLVIRRKTIHLDTLQHSGPNFKYNLERTSRQLHVTNLSSFN